jgi:chaperonin GroES
VLRITVAPSVFRFSDEVAPAEKYAPGHQRRSLLARVVCRLEGRSATEASAAIDGGHNSIMKVRPLYDRIVVKRIDEPEATRTGIIIPDSAREKPQKGEVMAVGHGKRLESGDLVALDVKVGDRILFARYSGSETRLDGTEYLIMSEDNILGILDSAVPAARKGS